MVIVINSVIGGFNWVHLWLADVTVQLQVSDCSHLSDYTVRLQPYTAIVKNEAIKFQEIVMAMINQEIDHAIKNPNIVLRAVLPQFCSKIHWLDGQFNASYFLCVLYFRYLFLILMKKKVRLIFSRVRYFYLEGDEMNKV